MAIDDLEVFFANVVTTEEGWFQLLIGPPFKEEWYWWPNERQAIYDRVRSVQDTNIYFSPHLFSDKNSHKEYVLPTRTIVSDLDNADINNFRQNPSFLTETSKDRHQGYWIVKQQLPVAEFEKLSKRVTYSIPNADHSGWPLGHKFRIPGTRNFKYNPPPIVRVVAPLSSERVYTVEEIESWVGGTETESHQLTVDDSWINTPPTVAPTGAGPRDILEKYRGAIGPKALAYFDNLQVDRSDALWALMLALFRAGASRDEVFWVAKNSENNKFKDHAFSGDRDLAKDVQRAQLAAESNHSDVMQMVQMAEHTGGTNNDRKRLISKIVFSDLENKGEFLHTDDGRLWYLHKNTGRPLSLGKRSESLDSFLDMVYGLNSSDGFHPFITAHLVNYTISMGRKAHSAVLSFYDAQSNTFYLHSGKGDVYRVQPNRIERVPDGQYGVLFPWRSAAEQIIQLEEPLPEMVEDWSEWMFEGWFDNLLDFTQNEARLLMRIWVIFTLFRDLSVSRPILTLLGQPGSGKSTLFRLIYTLIYGRIKSLNAVSSVEDFDFLVSTDPVVVFDNVDTWTGWLPDRLALSASSSDLIKRKLYTDSDVVTLKRQAILGITAHDPHFGRADVVDRMIILNFERRFNFTAESILFDRVSENRGALWGAILKDVQKILVTPMVPLDKVPMFRISDFARVGAWIATALGKYDEFVSVIDKLRNVQVAFSLSEDELLIDGIKRWQARRNGTTPEYVSPGYLWEQLSIDPVFARTYKSSTNLGKKIWTMKSNLSAVFKMDYLYDANRGVRTWKIDPLPPGGVKQGTSDGQ